METRYLTAAETAKLVRVALKGAFPGRKFSVRSETYSMGASIDVSWTDGPTSSAVEAVVERFRGADFDGMVDMKVYRQHWLTPSGEIILARVEASTGDPGYRAPDEVREVTGGEPVHLGADFIFCNRHLSPAARSIVEAAKAQKALIDSVHVLSQEVTFA